METLALINSPGDEAVIHDCYGAPAGSEANGHRSQRIQLQRIYDRLSDVGILGAGIDNGLCDGDTQIAIAKGELLNDLLAHRLLREHSGYVHLTP